MYWIRLGSAFDLLLAALCCALWLAGGWLLAVHTFRLRSNERLLGGTALGLVLFIALSNLAANFLPLTAAYWTAAGMILALGAWQAWQSQLTPRLPLAADLQAWPQVAAFLGLSVLFTLIGRGLGIFDDYLHLPLVSSMASGDIPPHFYLYPDDRLAYHYGLQVLAAFLVRLGGFFPWSAWDITKALALSLTGVLAWVWFRRVTRSSTAAWLGAALLVLASGTRWLLLLLPPAWLEWLSGGITLINTAADSGATLAEVMSTRWLIEGDGPLPFPFAFHNSALVTGPMYLGASATLPYINLLLLMLLVSKRRISWLTSLLIAVLFAALALSAEHIFVFLWLGIALAGLSYLAVRRRRGLSFWPDGRDRQVAAHWLAILLLAGLLSVFQGAFLTEAVRNFIAGLQGTAVARGEFDYFTFSFQWPPSLVSGHLGFLSLFDPRQLIVLLAELGPAWLAAPVVTARLRRWVGRRDLLPAGLALAALGSFVFPIFFLYGVPRSSLRMPAFAMWAWLLLGFPVLWRAYQAGRSAWRPLLPWAYAASVLAGVVILAVQFVAIPAPQFSPFIELEDAQMSNALWDRLPAGSQVLDRVPHRAVTIFGRATRAQADFYNGLPEWYALIDNPQPGLAAAAGYEFIYMDRDWWQQIGPDLRQALEQDCVQRVEQKSVEEQDFRWLLDVSRCR